MEPYVVFIGGTGASGPLGAIYYREIKRRCRVDRLISIPVFGTRCIERSRKIIQREIDRNLPVGKPLVLVGHSQGGLLAADIALHRQDVSMVLPISAPFHGTWLCDRRMIGAFGDMAPGSRYTQELVSALSEAGTVHPRFDVHSLMTTNDWLVRPAFSSYLPGFRNYILAHNMKAYQGVQRVYPEAHVELARTGHISEIMAKRVIDQVVRLVRQPNPLAKVS